MAFLPESMKTTRVLMSVFRNGIERISLGFAGHVATTDRRPTGNVAGARIRGRSPTDAWFTKTTWLRANLLSVTGGCRRTMFGWSPLMSRHTDEQHRSWIALLAASIRNGGDLDASHGMCWKFCQAP